jgi:hypothetical protein
MKKSFEDMSVDERAKRRLDLWKQFKGDRVNEMLNITKDTNRAQQTMLSNAERPPTPTPGGALERAPHLYRRGPHLSKVPPWVGLGVGGAAFRRSDAQQRRSSEAAELQPVSKGEAAELQPVSKGETANCSKRSRHPSMFAEAGGRTLRHSC